MSHFIVVVIGDDIYNQLAPYNENRYTKEPKWDWYVIGGRWKGYFKAKPGKKGKLGESGAGGNESRPGYYDQIKVEDIDFESMKKEKLQRAAENWVMHIKRKNKENYNSYFEYGITKEDTKESYLEHRGSVAPFAYIHLGEWYENEEMGWFGITRNRKDKPKNFEKQYLELIKSLPKDSILTAVDCHI